MPKTFPFPQDLLDAQASLDETRVACELYALTLPWSAEPMPGWEANKQLHSNYISEKPDSPGYTDEQAAQVARYQAELVRLSTAVSTHPYWATLDEGVVEARMALKHAHEQPAEA